MPQKGQVKITRLEEDEAILALEDGREIMWPKDQMPAEAKIGDEFCLVKASEAQHAHPHTAKDVLNDLLRND